ncbi:hypothetical protein QI303_03240 [Staphylococcus saprophyticus]|nr:hypothetical protein [Staphylococcus saprophyticus]MDW4083663.1 hypothetical protein [Staphylococcus saprophyticus]
MKIKQKKQLNLPQLIEYIWDNNVKNERYRCSDSNPYEYVWINENSDVELDEDMRISKNDTFTVEVEEEIDEDTWFPELVIRTVAGDYRLHKQGSINDFKHSTFNDVEAFYIPNDDLTLTLIWTHEKGLVE